MRQFSALVLLAISWTKETAALATGPTRLQHAGRGFKRQKVVAALRDAGPMFSRSPARPPGPLRYPIVGTLPAFIMEGGVDGLFDVHNAMYSKYGDCYALPIFGSEQVFFCNPVEFEKVFHREGKYPGGGSADIKVFEEFYAGREADSEHILKSMRKGPEWYEWRQALTPDLFAKPAANSYLPIISHACAVASKSAPKYVHEFDDFISRLAFDMFSSAMYGDNPATADKENASQEDVRFVVSAQTAFSLAGRLMIAPWEKSLGTDKFIEFQDNMEVSTVFSEQRTRAKLAEQTTSQVNRNSPGQTPSSSADPTAASGCPVSMVGRMFARGDPKISTDFIAQTTGSLLLAGVDTTSYVTNWLLINIAENPDAQRKLAQELKTVLGGKDLDNAEYLPHLPYLQACIRESHRLSPAAPIGPSRTLDEDIELSGFTHPAGTKLTMNMYAYQHDPKYVDDPFEFRPERWLPEAVRARKNTPAAALDHRVLATPFGIGARMCVGARVAHLEMLALTARFVQDWEIELDPPNPEWKMKMSLMFKPDPFPKFKLTPRSRAEA